MGGIMNVISAALTVAIGSWVFIPGGGWSITPIELSEIQNGLESYVKEQASIQHRHLPEWSNYTFQYQGQINDNKKLVFINAFCISPPGYIQRQFVIVLDGGTCFFQVKYDPTTKKYYDLMFNGEA